MYIIENIKNIHWRSAIPQECWLDMNVVEVGGGKREF
jgi:hypothetical protein